MVKIKPFCGIRPPKQYASEVASRPYDGLNPAEANAEATERSLLHIIKPEIDFEPIADEHSQEVYDKAVENFRAWREKGWLEQDPGEYYYIYAQTMDGRTQYGLTMCCHYVHVIGGNEVTIAAFLDNVLTHHFTLFQDEIDESFKRHMESYNL